MVEPAEPAVPQDFWAGERTAEPAASVMESVSIVARAAPEAAAACCMADTASVGQAATAEPSRWR
ncbi:Uncharacterised protein [Mycobacterium tuberculosis]|uniref:Uncharacterized protein n=1 Tax=Mycobacterium tuberculosis TaxID=1773 RepID=A0A654U4U5_MYCTX|nr:Uncharacterised protein [Mycobacterium tuberculosis]